MTRLALRSLAAHKARLVMTAVAVVLGIAFVTGTLIYTDTVNANFDRIFSNMAEVVDVEVRREEPTGTGEFGGQLLDASLAGTVAGVEGVAEVDPTVRGLAQIVAPDGELIVPQGPPTFGISWSESPLSDTKAVEGSLPVGMGEVVIDAVTARTHGFSVGNVITVIIDGTPRPFRLVGTAEDARGTPTGGATFAIFDLPTAQALLAEPGKVDTIAASAQDGVSAEALRDRIRAVLPPGHVADTGDEVAANAKTAINGVLGIFRTALLAFAGVSLFVGGFLVVNTFGIVVAQRTRELGLLRTLGASASQVRRVVLFEAVAVGVVASAVGVAIGVLVAGGLRSVLSGAGIDLPADGLTVTTRALGVPFVLGLVVTLFAATMPAFRAGRVAPLAALRTAGARAGARRGRFLGPIIRVLSAPIALFGPSGKLARANAVREPRRTVATASALTVGMALIVGAAIVSATLEDVVAGEVQKSLRADLSVRNVASATFADSAATTVGAIDAVESVSAIRTGGPDGARWLLDGEDKLLFGVDPATFGDAVNLDVTDGSIGDLARGGMAVRAEAAAAHGWRVGDTVPMQFPDGAEAVRVAAIFANRFDSDYLIGEADFRRHFADTGIGSLLVTLRDGADGAQAKAAVSQAFDANPAMVVQDQDDMLAEVKKQLGMLLGLVTALLALTVLIAVLGIANTLALSIIERTKEIGLLRAVGAARTQVRRMIRSEAVVVGVLGALTGVLVGVLLGRLGVSLMGSLAADHFTVPMASLVAYVAGGALLGVVASVWPARKAAHLDVLSAIATE